jgi:hypothetical protein
MTKRGADFVSRASEFSGARMILRLANGLQGGSQWLVKFLFIPAGINVRSVSLTYDKCRTSISFMATLTE